MREYKAFESETVSNTLSSIIREQQKEKNSVSVDNESIIKETSNEITTGKIMIANKNKHSSSYDSKYDGSKEMEEMEKIWNEHDDGMDNDHKMHSDENIEENVHRIGNDIYDRNLGERVCDSIDCNFVDADSVPTNQLYLSSLTSKEKDHIKQYHKTCYVIFVFYVFDPIILIHLYCIYLVYNRIKDELEEDL